MLVLTRRVGEAIVMDNDIRVTVLSVTGGKVRLGIAAPPFVEIMREEILDRKAQHSWAPLQKEHNCELVSSSS